MEQLHCCPLAYRQPSTPSALLQFLVHCKQDPTLPDDLHFAVHMSSGTYVDVSLKQLARWRRTALRDFKRQVGHLVEEIKPLFTDRYGVSASILKRTAHPERIAAAAASIAWPDHDLALLACGGARLVGEVEKAFIYRPTHIVPDWSTGELLRTAEAYVQEVMLRPQPKAAEAKVIWEKTLEEVDLEYMLGPFSKEQIDQEWGLGKWRCIVRFAIEQRDGSFRVIDIGKSGGHNGSTAAYERIHTCGSGASVALVREFTRLINAPLEGNNTVLQGTQDMKKAFRQIPIHDESLRFCVIAVWHPQNGCWKFFQMFAMPFGLMAAVLQFKRSLWFAGCFGPTVDTRCQCWDTLMTSIILCWREVVADAAMCDKPLYHWTRRCSRTW